MTGFDINEDLKERCILLGASSCYTEYYPPNIFFKHNYTPFWYNKIVLPASLNKSYILVLCSLVDDYLEELQSLGFEDIVTDVREVHTNRHIYYWILSDKTEFLEKELLLDK